MLTESRNGDIASYELRQDAWAGKKSSLKGKGSLPAFADLRKEPERVWALFLCSSSKGRGGRIRGCCTRFCPSPEVSLGVPLPRIRSQPAMRTMAIFSMTWPCSFRKHQQDHSQSRDLPDQAVIISHWTNQRIPGSRSERRIKAT